MSNALCYAATDWTIWRLESGFIGVKHPHRNAWDDPAWTLVFELAAYFP